VGTDSGVVLDAGSLSKDPDNQLSVPFRYNWTCEDATNAAALEAEAAAQASANTVVVGGVVLQTGTAATVVLPPCPTVSGANISFTSSDLSGTTGSSVSGVVVDGGILRVSGGVLVPNRLYRFSVLTAKGEVGGLIPRSLRTAKASVDLQVKAGAPPTVFASVVSGLVGSSSGASFGKVDAAQRVILEASARSSAGNVKFQWSLLNQPTELTSVVFATPSNLARVTLTPNAMPVGTTLTFQIIATDIAGQQGVGTISIDTNQPPYAGYVQVSPLTGTVLATPFTIEALQWTDDPADLPLSYLFGYYKTTPTQLLAAIAAGTQGTDSATSFVPLGAAFESRAITSGVLLPQGAGSEYNLTIGVRVRDALGAVVESFIGQDGNPVTVVVAPPSTNDATAVTALVANAAANLETSYDEGDTAGLLASIAVFSEVLSNTDPCALCTETEECSAGVCVPLPSPSASPSSLPPSASPSPAASRLPDASPSPSPTPIPSPAARCPGSSKTLAAEPNPYSIPAIECSGHGVCQRSPALCNEEDPRGCSASCVCDQGWGRRDCLLSDSELRAIQEQKTRFLLLQSRLMGRMEASDSAASQQSQSLASITRDPSELTSEAQDTALRMAADIPRALLQGSSKSMGQATGRRLLDVVTSLGQATSSVDSNSTAFLSGSGSTARRLHESFSYSSRRLSAAEVHQQDVDAALIASMVHPDSWAKLTPEKRREAAIKLLQFSRERPPPSPAPEHGRAFHGRFLQVDSTLNRTALEIAVNRSRAATAQIESAVDAVVRAVTVEVQPGEAPVVVQGSGIAVSSTRSFANGASSASLPSGASFDLGATAGTALRNANASVDTGSTALDVRAVAWSSNPFAWSAAAAALQTGVSEGLASRSAAVTSLTVAMPGDGSEVVVQNMPDPVVIRMPVTAGTDPSQFECAYWHPTEERWSRQGMVLVGMERPATGNTWTAVCASTHLTAFSADAQVSPLEFNTVDPFKDAGLLKNYLDPNNIFPIVILAVLFSAFLLSWLVSAMCDWRCRGDLRKLRRAHFLRYGEVRTGTGAGELHVEEEKLEARLRKEQAARLAASLAGRGLAATTTTGDIIDTPQHAPAAAATDDEDVYVPSRTRFLRGAKKRGTFFLVVQHIVLNWIERLRRLHSWGSTFASTMDEQLLMTRPQRIAVLAASALVSMAVGAFFFGKEPATMGTRLLVSFIASVSMLPTDRLFPILFERANAFRSRTVELSMRRRKSLLARLLCCRRKHKSKLAAELGPAKLSAIKDIEQDEMAGGSLRAAGDAPEAKSTTTTMVSSAPRLSPASTRLLAGTKALQAAALADRGCAWRGVTDALEVVGATDADAGALAMSALLRTTIVTMGSETGAISRETAVGIWRGGVPPDYLVGAGKVLANHPCLAPTMAPMAEVTGEQCVKHFAVDNAEQRELLTQVTKGLPSINELAKHATTEALRRFVVAAEAMAAELRSSSPAPTTVSPGMHKSKSANPIETQLTLKTIGRKVMEDLGIPVAEPGRESGLEHEVAAASAGGDDAMPSATAGTCKSIKDRADVVDLMAIIFTLMKNEARDKVNNDWARSLSGTSSTDSASLAALPVPEAQSVMLRLPRSPEADLVLSGVLTFVLQDSLDSVIETMETKLKALGATREAGRAQRLVAIPVIVPEPLTEADLLRRGAEAGATAEEAVTWLAGAPEEGDDEEALPAVRSLWQFAAPLVFGLVSLTQAWTGLLSILFGLFITAKDLNTPDMVQTTNTVLVSVLLGLGMVIFGWMAYSVSREGRMSYASALLFMAVACEATGIALVVELQLAYAREAAIVMLGLQALPAFLCLLGVFFISYVQRQLDVRTRRVLETVTAIQADHRKLSAVVMVQRHFRGFIARNKLTRMREMRKWDDLRSGRRFILGLIYTALILISAFALYLCLIFGVKFAPNQAYTWLISSITSFILDAIFNEPVVHLAFALVDFFKSIRDQSARDVAILGLAAAKGVRLNAFQALRDQRARGGRRVEFSDLLVDPE
jgi:hypothetical protein